jgi:hypothetical protein
MHRFLMRNHAPVASKELKTCVAVIGLTLLATAAWADPQSEISAYRKTYGLPAVTADAKLTELARQHGRQVMSVSGPKLTSGSRRGMSAFGGKADMARDLPRCPLMARSGHWLAACVLTSKCSFNCGR